MNQNGNLEKVSDILRSRCSEAKLVSSLDRIQVLLESFIASFDMEFDQLLPRNNIRRAMASRSMSSFIDDCYGGYQHVLSYSHIYLQTKHILELKRIVSDRDALQHYVSSELEPLYRRVFNRHSMECV